MIEANGVHWRTSETRCTSNCTPPQPPPPILVPNTAPTFVPGAAPTSQPPPTNGLMDLAPGTAQPAMYVASAPHLQSGNLVTTYTYDAAGNRASMTANGTTTTYTYNALNQLVGSSTGAAYTYDARGNLKTINNGTTYTFDVRNHLTQATVSGQTATFAYDGLGERIQQVASGTTTNYLWDALSPFGDVVLATATGSMTAQSSYVMDGSELLTQNLTQGGTTTQSYYLQDGQGSVRTLTNASGVATDRYAYDAFGNAYTPGTSGSTTNPYRYTGQQFDTSTGLYDLRARYYDPTQGRFLGQDTNGVALSNPVELNRYAYTANNPINGFDPSGHDLVGTGEIEGQDAVATSGGRAVANGFIQGAIAGAAGYYSGLFVASIVRGLTQWINGGNCCGDPLLRLGELFDESWQHFFAYSDLVMAVAFGALYGALSGRLVYNLNQIKGSPVDNPITWGSNFVQNIGQALVPALTSLKDSIMTLFTIGKLAIGAGVTYAFADFASQLFNHIQIPSQSQYNSNTFGIRVARVLLSGLVNAVTNVAGIVYSVNMNSFVQVYVYSIANTVANLSGIGFTEMVSS